ncbi:hypothetical protein BURPS305_0658 [Burkholderia pseudomallei 305]|nr:hypothetical protein BURPS305_0658 [Burkholderia pseudomallei 305]
MAGASARAGTRYCSPRASAGGNAGLAGKAPGNGIAERARASRAGGARSRPQARNIES